MCVKVELTLLARGSDVGYRRKGGRSRTTRRFSPSFSAGGSGRDGEAEGAGALVSVSEAPVGVHRQLVMSRIREKFKKTSLCYS